MSFITQISGSRFFMLRGEKKGCQTLLARYTRALLQRMSESTSGLMKRCRTMLVMH